MRYGAALCSMRSSEIKRTSLSGPMASTNNRRLFSEVLVYRDGRVNLLRAQGQGERSGALHVRDGPGSEDDRRQSRGPGRRASRLNIARSPTPESYTSG